MKALLLILLLSFFTIIPSFAQQRWTLRQCIDYAIENNLSIKQQKAVYDQNVISLNTAKNSRLPNLNANMGQSFDFGRGLTANNTYAERNTQNTSFSLGTNIPLFTGLQTSNNIALCKLNLKAAIADLDKAKDDISIQITSIFLQVLFNKELLDVALNQVKLSREQLEQKKVFFESGKVTKVEYYGALSRVSQDEMSLVQADNNYQLSLLELCQFLELPSFDDFDIYHAVDEGVSEIFTPESVYLEALQSRPEIKAAQYRVEGAFKNISIMRSGLLPKLSFGAGIGTSYYNVSGLDNASFRNQLKQNLNKYLSFSLSIPLFTRFETRNRIKSAKIQHRVLCWKLEETEKKLFKEIQQAYYNAIAAKSKIGSSNSALKVAETTFYWVSEQYSIGKVTAAEYNEARTNWMRATSDMIQAKYDYLFRTKILDFYKGVPLSL